LTDAELSPPYHKPVVTFVSRMANGVKLMNAGQKGIKRE